MSSASKTLAALLTAVVTLAVITACRPVEILHQVRSGYNLDWTASLPGEPSTIDAAGLTREGTPLLTIEHHSIFDPFSSQRHLVIVAGLKGNPLSARMALDAVRWFKTSASAQDRKQWVVSVLPMANPTADQATLLDTFPPTEGFFNDPDHPEFRYVWRWVRYQAPDLVVEFHHGSKVSIQSSDDIRTDQFPASPGGSLAAALSIPSNKDNLGLVDTMIVYGPKSSGPLIMQEVLARASARPSNLRVALTTRLKRDPLTIAKLLAQRYPETPSIDYRSALAWVHTLKLARLTGEKTLESKVIRQLSPWLKGQTPLFEGTVNLSDVAGTIVFSELETTLDEYREVAEGFAADGVARAAAESSSGLSALGSGWSDDMFLGTIAAITSGNETGISSAVRLIKNYANRLQRRDGLFRHSLDAETAWGRGNGFAALGLTETLTTLGAEHPEFSELLGIYDRQISAMKALQASDGMWRQVVDVPGSYKETTVTAMILTAMARGIRLGWIDDSYLSTVRRGWLALLAHVENDGALVDVCISTGAGPTLRHYLDRPAVNGPDDRGGAMVLGAALEIHALNLWALSQ